VALWAAFMETREVDWTPTFVLVLAWLVIVLSFGAISFLYIMIERGEVWRAAALFYLIPATTALMGFIGFGETLTPLQIVGMAIVTLSVLVARR
ncbi:MAG: DMT family transporter, partial [Pseudomonadota bacterium]